MANQEAINLCTELGVAALRAANDLFEAFVRELGGANFLPEQFTLDVPAMTQLERDIEQAIVDGELQKTKDLCADYTRRFTAYIEGWRIQIAQKTEAIGV